MSTYYHGSRNGLTLHEGVCLVNREDVAESYARGGDVVAVDVALSGLVVEDVDVTDEMRDEVEYPGDRAEDRAAFLARGVDAIIYDDETETGRQHRCLRLLSPRALAAVSVLA